MFQPDTSWSLPAHLFMVSEWSARCHKRGDPMGCVNAVENPLAPPHELQNPTGRKPDYAWTDLTYLLHRRRVSWRYYVFAGAQPDCDDDAAACRPVEQSVKTPGIWNPLPWFDTVRRDHELRNVKPIRNFFAAARHNALPAVSWVIPNNHVLSFDAYAKFIEDDFLRCARIDPKTDGRPDPRPTVRENVAQLGNLASDFNFNQKARPPLILPLHPRFS
jgi:phospholipase C